MIIYGLSLFVILICYFLPPHTVQWTCWLFLASDRYKSRGSAGRARKMKDKKDNGRLGITRIWRELENPDDDDERGIDNFTMSNILLSRFGAQEETIFLQVLQLKGRSAW